MWFLLACAPEAPVVPPVQAPGVAEVEAVEVETVEVEAPEVEAPEVEAPEVEPGLDVVEVAPLPAPIDALDPAGWTDPQDLVNELSGLTLGASVLLVDDQLVREVPCKGAERLDALHDGTWSCVLSEPATLADWPLDRGARAHMHASGGLAHVTFGDLRSPRESVTIGGVPCLSRAGLHAEGTVRSCTLARGATLGTTALPKGSDVTLRPDGGLVDATIYDRTTISGSDYDAGLLLFDGGGGVAGHQPGVFGD